MRDVGSVIRGRLEMDRPEKLLLSISEVNIGLKDIRLLMEEIRFYNKEEIIYLILIYMAALTPRNTILFDIRIKIRDNRVGSPFVLAMIGISLTTMSWK